MVVEALQRPFPALVAKAGCQPAGLCAGLIDCDTMAGLRQIVRRRQPSDPRPDNRDIHAALRAANDHRPTTKDRSSALSFVLRPSSFVLTATPPGCAPQPRARNRPSQHD